MKPQHFLIAIAVAVLFFLFELFNPFIKAIFVAFLLSVATNSLDIFITNRVKSQTLSAILMTIVLAVIFFVPVMYCIFSFANFINKLDQQAIIKNFENIQNWVENIPSDFQFLKHQLNLILDKIDVAEAVKNVLSIGAYLGKNSASFMIDMVMILIFYFFFTLYGTGLSHYIKDILPLKKEDANALFYESSNVMSIVLYSILVTAILEGMLFGFFISIYGYNGFLLGVLYGFASLVPVVGGLIMWLPIAIYEIFKGNLYDAIVIISYSIIVISIIADTFVKPIIIKYINQRIVRTPSKINELLIFFSIIAGLSTFGFWGMIIGPAMVTFFISIVQLLKKYSNDMI
ncbi:AI-2E family transporter [Malaciobacter mytili]|uniref:AI-2E family transporter n=1 Tax=Malaciobacter mytili LMG 24559 TaxID=1032238 RepID=A0AAX2AHP2_9BACT|nr:AI-2E family transporter [Malaciobacter mytili]AXH15730.1 acid membrane antigen A [Malaciobacter mytili LMG 24559]RXI38949.1 AI-2E family transporter [Malaciobacter mytili]RXK15448.1 AI-2E family transporter [Malaciobacter mytili LMG 24559]